MELRQSRHTQHQTRNTLHERFSLHSYVAGSGEPVLCISGFGCDAYNYEWIWPVLARRSNVVLLENRGMGLSQKVTQSYELEEMANDAVEAMLQLGHPRFHVVGISMGGMISQLIAINHPERVTSLSLLCTTSAGDRFVPLPPLTPEMLKKAATIPEPQRTEFTLRAITHPRTIEKSPTLFAEMVRLRREHGAPLDQLLLQKDAVDRFLAGPAIPVEKIACPTLVLHGDTDRFVAAENGRRLAALIPNATLQLVPESDHYFFLEKAEEVASHINEFHRGLSGKNVDKN